MKKIGLLIIALVVVLGVAMAVKNRPSQDTSMSDDTQMSDDTLMTDESMMQGEESADTIEMTSGNYFFKPNKVTVKAGKVTVHVADNQGFHTFVIDELGVNQTLKSGTTFSFEAKPGTYSFYCSVGNHRALGMEGTLTVE